MKYYFLTLLIYVKGQVFKDKIKENDILTIIFVENENLYFILIITEYFW